MKKAICLVVGAGFVLAGCDGPSPAGANVSSTTEQRTTVGETLDRLKELSLAKQKGNVEQAMLLPLVIRASQEFRTTFNGEKNSYLDQMNCALADDFSPEQKTKAEIVKALTEKDGIDVSAIPEKGHELSRFLHGTRNEHAAGCLAFLWKFTVSPVTGWPRSNSRDPFDMNTDGMRKYATDTYTVAMAAAKSIYPIISQLSEKTGGYTVAELEQATRKMLLENGSDYRAISLQEAARVRELKGQYTLDMTGKNPAPVHYLVPADSADVSIDGGGIYVVRDGVDWYGRGYLQGTRYSVEAINTNTATMTRSAGTAQGTESSNSNSTSAEGRTQ